MTDTYMNKERDGLPPFEEDSPVSNSIGETINESLAMPQETLTNEALYTESLEGDDASAQQDMESYASPEPEIVNEGWQNAIRQTWTKIYESIHAKPFPYLLGAAGIGFVCGKRMRTSAAAAKSGLL